jgi:hypothetical protein
VSVESVGVELSPPSGAGVSPVTLFSSLPLPSVGVTSSVGVGASSLGAVASSSPPAAASSGAVSSGVASVFSTVVSTG